MILGVIDIETTGFLPKGKIVEVGIATANTDTGMITGVFSAVVREPGVEEHKEAWIFENSTLTHAEVMQASLLDDYREHIQGLINSCDCVTAFNSRFDFGFLRSRNFVIDHEAECLMLALTPVMKLPPARIGTQYKWPNAEEAWKYMFPDVPYVEAHRGCDDAIHEAGILFIIFLFIALEMFRRGVLDVPQQGLI